MIIEKNQKGIALYVSIVIMGILLAMGLGLSVLIIGEMKIMRNIGNSVVAFHAADTGIENALYNMRQIADTSDIGTTYLDSPDDSISYFVDHVPPGSLFESWRSVGHYKGDERAIKIDQEVAFDFLFYAFPPTSFCIHRPGSSGTTVSALWLQGGQEDVTFEAQILPPDPLVTHIFDPPDGTLSSLSPNLDSDFTIEADAAAPLGTYTVIVTAHTDVKDISIDPPMSLIIQDTSCP